MNNHLPVDDPQPAGHPLLSGYWTWDIRHDRIFGCATMMDYFGHSIEEAAEGLPVAACMNSIDGKDRSRVTSAINQAIEQHLPYRQAYQVHTRSQGKRRIMAQGRCYYNGKGEPSLFPGWFIDVTGIGESRVTSLLHCRHLTDIARHAARDAGHDFLCYLLEIALREADNRLGPKGVSGNWTH